MKRKIVIVSMLVLAGTFFILSIPEVGLGTDETNTNTWVIGPNWNVADTWTVNVNAIGPMPITPPVSFDIMGFLYNFGPFIAFGVTFLIASWRVRKWKKKYENVWHFLLRRIGIPNALKGAFNKGD